MKFLITSLRYTLLLQNSHKCQNIQCATIAYQFKKKPNVYYPDRQLEMQRIKEQQKSELVIESQQRKRLPKDYYYRILGLHKRATIQEIKAAYYTLAKRYHPDSGNSSNDQKFSERFQEISNAYHILTDESKKLEYDQMGEIRDEKLFLEMANAQKSSKQFKLTPVNLLRGPSGNVSLKDSQTESPITNDDKLLISQTNQKLEITFLESVHGVKRIVDLKYLSKCPQCNGNSQRMAGRIAPEPCRKCNGSGQIKKKTQTYIALNVCDQCHGKRYINRNQCDLCECRGFVQESTKLTIHVPPCKTGDIISVENPKTGQVLNYRINVEESKYYQRFGNNVLTEKYIKLSEAILGGTVKVRGIYENLELNLEPGTESHTKITLKGKGIKGRGECVGDHIVLVKIRVPRQLTMKQRQLMLAFAKTEDPTFDGIVY
ncbi:dnaJ homolog l(2)tid, mitochondrial [Haematobia irritans]|uniref:dnaJ homolog l(2)tid, mitochondrial n=1 Tax=Haematobia irritans TaxID=7368 RepID=UPI003F4F8742